MQVTSLVEYHCALYGKIQTKHRKKTLHNIKLKINGFGYTKIKELCSKKYERQG